MTVDRESTLRLPFPQRKEVALRMLKLRCTFREIREATGVSFTSLSKWKKSLPEKYQHKFKDGVNGLYLRSKDTQNIGQAQAILHNIKSASGSMSQIEGIVKLGPFIQIIDDYFSVPDSHKEHFISSMRTHSKAALSEYETSLLKAIVKT